MASPASVATLGSPARPVVAPGTMVGKVRVAVKAGPLGVAAPRWWLPSRLPSSGGHLCKCMVVANLVEEKRKINFSAESAFKESNGSSISGLSDDGELILKPPPRPIPEPATAVEPASGEGSSEVGRRSPVIDREKVNESLGEILEKVEKLGTARPVIKSVDNRSAPSAPSPSVSLKVNKVSNSSDLSSVGNSKMLKSVWRKGNPVASVQKVMETGPRTEKPTTSAPVAADLNATPLLPSKPMPLLQQRPSVAPPAAPVVKKVVAPKERKPILIDKFASKRPTVDAIVAPGEPIRSPSMASKDDRRKRPAAPGALRRRMANAGDSLNSSDPSNQMPRRGRKAYKASRKEARLRAAKAAAPVKVEILEVGEEGMLIEDLAYNLAVSEANILKYLFMKGVPLHNTQTLDKDLVKMVCKEYDVEVLELDPQRIEELAKKKEVIDEDDIDMLEPRPPVITIMGHVDHGKTTLLDYLRKSKVVASEAGGITQRIGAYQVQVPFDGKLQTCVFLDTPGHEAFGAMRARGARVTDITIIVVAADDGVRPQTNEAIAHAKAAGVPIIIAINKIDAEGAEPERVMQELAMGGLMPEAWGGDTPVVQISALKGENIEELLETVMLVAELQELKANPSRSAKGTVIEASVDKAKGPVATLIVQNGTIKKGDIVVCGEAYGKVRAMFGDHGVSADEAGPSMAVQVVGLSNVPIAGDEFEVVDNLDIAREKANACAEALHAARVSAKSGDSKATLSSIASAVAMGKYTGLDRHQLNLILKVDFQGTIEAIRQAIQVLPQENVTLKFLLQAPGDITLSDVDLAVATEAVIVGFNVKAPGSVKTYAGKKNVEIRLYQVIYDLIDDIRDAMEGLLDPAEEQETIGEGQVQAVFSSGSSKVAGCMITVGKVAKDCCIKVMRKGKTIYTGKIDSLRRVKEDVNEVGAGLECGIGVDGFNEWSEGDYIVAFNTVKKKRTLEEASASVTAALTGAGLEL